MGNDIINIKKTTQFDFKKHLENLIDDIYGPISKEKVDLCKNINNVLYIENKQMIPTIFLALNDLVSNKVSYERINDYLFNFYGKSIEKTLYDINEYIEYSYSIKDDNFDFYVNGEKLDFSNKNCIQETLNKTEFNDIKKDFKEIIDDLSDLI